MFKVLLVLLGFPIAVLAQGVIKPPPVGSGAQAYLIYAMVGGMGMLISTGGTLLIGIATFYKASMSKDGACNFSPGDSKRLNECESVMFYNDIDDTKRPQFTRRTHEETEKFQGELLSFFVEQRDFMAALRDMIERHTEVLETHTEELKKITSSAKKCWHEED